MLHPKSKLYPKVCILNKLYTLKKKLPLEASRIACKDSGLSRVDWHLALSSFTIQPSRYLLYRALGALVPYIVGTGKFDIGHMMIEHRSVQCQTPKLKTTSNHPSSEHSGGFVFRGPDVIRNPSGSRLGLRETPLLCRCLSDPRQPVCKGAFAKPSRRLFLQ